MEKKKFFTLPGLQLTALTQQLKYLSRSNGSLRFRNLPCSLGSILLRTERRMDMNRIARELQRLMFVLRIERHPRIDSLTELQLTFRFHCGTREAVERSFPTSLFSRCRGDAG
jgi:hypothetical protein